MDHDEKQGPRCTAKSKRSGVQCRNFAVQGHHVCRMHGAGNPSRIKDGTRKDPRTANLKHGLYARSTVKRLGELVGEFERDQEQLYSVDTMMARLWAMLTRMDEIEQSFDIADFVDAIHSGDDAELFKKQEQAKDFITRLSGIRTLISEMFQGVRTKQRLEEKQGDAVSRGQLVAMLMVVHGWVLNLCSDESVRREDIPNLLLSRFEQAGDFDGGFEVIEAESSVDTRPQGQAPAS
mgnify:FL=1